jgi:hypothetical protein
MQGKHFELQKQGQARPKKKREWFDDELGDQIKPPKDLAPSNFSNVTMV